MSRPAPAPAARRCFLRALAACAAWHLAAPAAAASDFPVRPIKFIVPYAAGGTTDLVARTLSEHMSKTLGQPVVVENRGGAGGNIGMDQVARAAPDGYTVGMGAISTNALNPHLYKNMPFDPRRDFTAIGMLGHSTIVLETHPAFGPRTVAELVAHAKQHPGLTYATAGAGTSMHLAGVLFAQMSQTQLTHVPYKGSAPLVADLMAGHIQLAFDNLPASLPHIQAGKLRPLAVAGAQRSPALPDVPTLAEAGLPGYVVEPWFGLFGPAKLPEAVQHRLSEALRQALADSAIQAKLQAAGFSPRASSPAELADLAAREYERLGKLAKDTQMQAH